MHLQTANQDTFQKVREIRVRQDNPSLDREEVQRKAARGEVNTFKGETVDAYVNHGRWVADCPLCNGAELVAPGEAMLCGSCGATHTVVFPDHATDIEEALAKRPAMKRNWNPDETVDELIAQNIERGIFPDDFKER